ncbi:unnamed protein product [Gemmata massiliana]|uniref:Uncharacterized protein n=1 Tax=Gemmata massiliana TaxID=1210884 RepID=A0A6P2DEE1_9BACT|nr:unnamed protein product [Gemmata massiliana]
MQNADDVSQTPTQTAPPTPVPVPPGTKPADMQVTCKLPNGSLLDTTYHDCVNVRLGTVVGKGGTAE